eukprot:Skav236701  [mRNA]  locus=scaffold7366:25394:25720:+ [translate_table: standard]
MASSELLESSELFEPSKAITDTRQVGDVAMSQRFSTLCTRPLQAYFRFRIAFYLMLLRPSAPQLSSAILGYPRLSSAILGYPRLASGSWFIMEKFYWSWYDLVRRRQP